MKENSINASGRDAFHRVPNLTAREDADALERVPTGFLG